MVMNIKRKRFFATMLVIAMMLCNVGTVFAAETTEADQPDSIPVEVDYENRVIKINWEDMIPVEEAEAAGVGIEPYSTKVDFVNKAGITSTDLSIPFTVPMVCTNATFILNCSYTDGTTGTLPCSMANYNGYVTVDGVGRTLLNGITLWPGVWEVKVENVTKPMAYSAKVYAYRP